MTAGTAGNQPGGGRRALLPHRKAASMPRRAFLVVVALCSAAVSSGADPSLGQLHISESWKKDDRPCTADELLPDPDWDGDYADMWDKSTLVRPPFDCSCNTVKASYFCPNLGHDGYPKWAPRAVTAGTCKPVARDLLKTNPFPPNFKVLFYGNSHLRQAVEGIACMYSRCISNRRVTMIDDVSGITEDIIVGPDMQCRGCASHQKSMHDLLESYGCFVGSEGDRACSCYDDNGVFQFDNGATIHYHFAHKENKKRIEDGIAIHGTRFDDYDAVVANVGNDPRMQPEDLLRTAKTLQQKEIPLIFLSTYDGAGNVYDWSGDQKAEFDKSEAKFVPVHRMVESMDYLTKGVIEGERNPHFCMPGPPNEIAILLLKTMWAIQGENERAESERGDGRRLRQ